MFCQNIFHSRFRNYYRDTRRDYQSVYICFVDVWESKEHGNAYKTQLDELARYSPHSTMGGFTVTAHAPTDGNCIIIPKWKHSRRSYSLSIFFYCFFFFLHFLSRKQSLIWITQTNYKIFKLINSQRSGILCFTAVAMVHIYVLKLMMTQIAVLLITDVDNFSAFCRAIMLIAFAIMFVSMQS